MSRRRLVLSSFVGAVGALGLGACAAEPPGARVQIAVAPLELPGIVEACYALTVTNGPGGTGDVVWTNPEVCSTRYGDGHGALSYVGTCDAGVSTDNTVVLELLSLDDANGPAAFVNPCGAPDNAPCQLEVACEENADVAVEFDLTIMREANQGFFDVAVNFEDVFCSAKVDCEYGPDQPITLLHQADGTPGPTAVVAFACTGGPGVETSSHLHLSPIEVACDAGSVWLDPTAGPGNVFTAASPDPDPSDAVWQYATYRGTEDLDCDGAPCNKLYWNTAIGYDPAASGCTIRLSATASSEAFVDGMTPSHTAYPVIAVSVPLTGAPNERLCTKNPLDGEGSGVTTGYTSLAESALFCHSYDGVAVLSTDPSQSLSGEVSTVGTGATVAFGGGSACPSVVPSTQPKVAVLTLSQEALQPERFGIIEIASGRVLRALPTDGGDTLLVEAVNDAGAGTTIVEGPLVDLLDTTHVFPINDTTSVRATLTGADGAPSTSDAFAMRLTVGTECQTCQANVAMYTEMRDQQIADKAAFQAAEVVPYEAAWEAMLPFLEQAHTLGLTAEGPFVDGYPTGWLDAPWAIGSIDAQRVTSVTPEIAGMHAIAGLDENTWVATQAALVEQNPEPYAGDDLIRALMVATRDVAGPALAELAAQDAIFVAEADRSDAALTAAEAALTAAEAESEAAYNEIAALQEEIGILVNEDPTSPLIAPKQARVAYLESILPSLAQAIDAAVAAHDDAINRHITPDVRADYQAWTDRLRATLEAMRDAPIAAWDALVAATRAAVAGPYADFAVGALQEALTAPVNETQAHGRLDENVGRLAIYDELILAYDGGVTQYTAECPTVCGP